MSGNAADVVVDAGAAVTPTVGAGAAASTAFTGAETGLGWVGLAPSEGGFLALVAAEDAAVSMGGGGLGGAPRT